MRIAKGCSYWIKASLIFGAVSLILTIVFYSRVILISMIFSTIALIAFFFSILFIFFFRDPHRDIGKNVVAPADGKILAVKTVDDDQDIGDSLQISTFMSVFNVHINRCPLEGIVKKMFHHRGPYVPAFKEEADKNDRLITILDTKIGKVKIMQVAGFSTRQICPYISNGETVRKGQRIGIIKLGSRVDVFLPKNKVKETRVEVGDNVKAGEDSIATVHA